MAKRAPTKKPKQNSEGTAAVTAPEKIAGPVEVVDPGSTDTVSVPKDQVRFYCPKHGDITNATLHLSFADEEGNKQGQYLYCLHCLNEVLLSLQKSGAIETVQIVIPDELAEQMGASPKENASTEEAPENAPAADPDKALETLSKLQSAAEQQTE